MSRGDERLEAALMRRAAAHRPPSGCPDNAFERYMLMMCDRPILPHHIAELCKRSGAKESGRSRAD